MSSFVANQALLDAAATPFDFSPSFETDAPLNVEQHLYDSPAAIAQDNEVAVNFLTVHNAPPQFWEDAGYEDPRLNRLDAPHAGARRLLSSMADAEYNDPIRARLDRPGVPRLLDAMEWEREDRIFRLERRMDTMYVVVNSLNEDFSHFALEHWGPFQASLLRYFGHRCHGAYCSDYPLDSPVIPPPPSRLGSVSPSLPSLESCSDNGGKEAEEEEVSSKSDDSFWTALSAIGQGEAGENEAEGGGRGSPGSVWVRVGELSLDGREEGDAGQSVSRCFRVSRVLAGSSDEDILVLPAERVSTILHMREEGNELLQLQAHIERKLTDIGRDELPMAKIERLEKDCLGFQEWTLVAEDERERQAGAIDLLKGEMITLKDLVQDLVDQTGRLEDDRVHFTCHVSELIGEVCDLQRRCQGEEGWSLGTLFVLLIVNGQPWSMISYEDLSDVDPNEIWQRLPLVESNLELVQRINNDFLLE
ncbi:hypothetical protein BJ322DRAFT_1016681 [Thelephora terrestris]|uniref:Uncharacterized protein n=1 Tax=Thelephora terrestris TaxID=56493 RepID=A0A9P6HWX3_9AGAM|nr:hypothetical protein BJ322DRAFT_1016681 [Thelephora terrestris]